MSANRRVRVRRARWLLALAVLAFGLGAYVAAESGGMDGRALARSFAQEWAARDYAAIYGQLDPGTLRNASPAHIASALRAAGATATLVSAKPAGRPRALSAGVYEVPVRVHTRMFGTLVLPYRLRITSHEGTTRVAWSRSVVFPGLRPGEQLTRTTNLPRRATLLASDGSVLAESPQGANVAEAGQRISPLGAAAAAVLGTVGPVPSDRRTELEAAGVPAQGPVGLGGLERALDERLRGTPGGELLAGNRVLASAAPRPAPPVRTSISPSLQQAAVAALGAQYGGIVAMRPSGQILAVAGIGMEGLQPPGSTFKMVTVSGVLAAHLASPHTVFPYATHATLDGVKLSNAHGEECGGTLETAFAVSCNSVFSPLGVKLGARRLVSSAERLGFNTPTGIPGVPESTLPSAGEIHGELDIGSTAIGQGSVLATPLQMATVAATVADAGGRPQPTFLSAPQPPARAGALPASVARTVRRLMLGVVRGGTGTAAAIPGVTVAGKTGTAELKSACPSNQSVSQEGTEGDEAQETCASDEAANTDAWFAAFAPAVHPRVVVCVLLVKDGAGGDTAAPVAREVLEAGLKGGS
ncbi:MAG TPA: penicillin-binding transpeptidase domain-containing protein [Solirubrobacteraceae bacterium]|nr:penicillin-binding transpeptidase domain-containing protein [Solirubrobacteraceae bacterium]